MSGKEVRPGRLESREVNESTLRDQSEAEVRMREFASVEEALREDRARVTPPAGLEDRVAAATRSATSGGRSWWSRWFTQR
jgi:hypothetical protein